MVCLSVVEGVRRDFRVVIREPPVHFSDSGIRPIDIETGCTSRFCITRGGRRIWGASPLPRGGARAGRGQTVSPSVLPSSETGRQCLASLSGLLAGNVRVPVWASQWADRTWVTSGTWHSPETSAGANILRKESRKLKSFLVE